MKPYSQMTPQELEAQYLSVKAEYKKAKAMAADLNMARGKPSPAQLDLSRHMLNVLSEDSNLIAEDGLDCANYGGLAGIHEARRFMAEILDTTQDHVILFGSASLNAMYDAVARAMTNGVLGHTPWSQLDDVKFLCPCPGYDRHFNICEHLGIDMVPIEMTPEGPDMSTIERLVASDESIKGIWCVPQYSNPQGYTYSDETVMRFANLKCAAKDFRIFWDNAYCVHHLYDSPKQQDHVANILDACNQAGNPDLVYVFCSTAKITFPGAGISCMAASKKNIDATLKDISNQTISHDKLNQLRHVRFLKDAEGLKRHMSKHAKLLRPKFELLLKIFDEDLSEAEVGTWTKPLGGYFITYTGKKNTARRIVELAKDAGVTLTPAGAPFPYGDDREDATLRIAPSFPSMEELEVAGRIFTLCARLATLEVLFKSR